ncbi:MAG TPA: MBL fold metallo-hydrolase RNA specificity domain-containing protein, partial [Flavobacteriales bacterium]|nr:MBL fold metallo-hydrolase RNA specificity domain-containing protein [Flavobacteriales bacterium]
VRARVTCINGLSAHAGQDELIDWLSKLKWTPSEIFIVHGEKAGAQGLQQKIKQVYGWNAGIPVMNQEVCISGEFKMI